MNCVQNLEYTYDAAGNITKIEDYSGFGGGKVVNYTYDDLYRMLTASTTVPASGGYKETYTYDRLGNILTGPQGSYTYAETNYANPHAVTSLGGSTVTYDNNGNVTAHGSDSYEWSYRDRLTKSTVGGLTTFYGYDFDNQRVTKGNGTATTTYVGKYYETTTATTTKYVFDNNGVLLATIEGTGLATSTNYIHGDHLNSTTITTDEDGDVVTTKDYLPFGSERVNTGEQVGRTFIGEYGDAETDLSYLNARYYSGANGKFISQDPIAKDVAMMKPTLEYILTVNKKPGEVDRETLLSNPQLLNLYSYSANNPIAMSDPSGKFCFFCVPAAGSIIKLIGIGLTGKAVIETVESAHENLVLPRQYPDAFTEEQKDAAPFKFGVDTFFNFGSKALPSEEAKIIVDTIFESAKFIKTPEQPKKADAGAKSFGQSLPPPRSIPSL